MNIRKKEGGQEGEGGRVKNKKRGENSKDKTFDPKSCDAIGIMF